MTDQETYKLVIDLTEDVERLQSLCCELTLALAQYTDIGPYIEKLKEEGIDR